MSNPLLQPDLEKRTALMAAEFDKVNDRLAALECRLDEARIFLRVDWLDRTLPSHKVPTSGCHCMPCEEWFIRHYDQLHTITPELLEKAASGMFLDWTTKQRVAIADRLNDLLTALKATDE
jgi:hypothetical protein